MALAHAPGPPSLASGPAGLRPRLSSRSISVGLRDEPLRGHCRCRRRGQTLRAGRLSYAAGRGKSLGWAATRAVMGAAQYRAWSASTRLLGDSQSQPTKVSGAGLRSPHRPVQSKISSLRSPVGVPFAGRSGLRRVAGNGADVPRPRSRGANEAGNHTPIPGGMQPPFRAGVFRALAGVFASRPGTVTQMRAQASQWFWPSSSRHRGQTPGGGELCRLFQRRPVARG